jgi:hypothetical protein
MDTLSHAVWGWALLRHRGRRAGALGALAGAAPDLLFFVPSKIDAVARHGWGVLDEGRDPGMWRDGGPPLTPALVEAYDRFYVWTHSLAMLAAACLIAWGLRRRAALWLALPYAVHVLMDVPTHERYQTKPLHPLSGWSFEGLTWSDARIFWPHVVLLVLVTAWVWRKHGSPWARDAAPGD